MKLTKTQAQKILSNYNLGELVKQGKVKKDDVVSYGQIIQTTKGKYFLKVLKKFNNAVEQGITISSRLYEKGFPTNKTFKKKKETPR